MTTPIISLSRCSIKHLYLFSALLLQVLLQIFHSSTYLLKKEKKPQTKCKASIYLLLSITQNGFESEKGHSRPSSAAWMQPMLSGVCSVWVRNSFSLISFLLAYQELDALKAKVPLLPAPFPTLSDHIAIFFPRFLSLLPLPIHSPLVIQCDQVVLTQSCWFSAFLS